MTGFIKIHRKILDWEWYNDANTCRLFFHLIFTANYKDGCFQGKAVKRGQVIIGLRKLSAKLGLSLQQVRTSLNKLKSSQEVTIESTHQYSIITLVNYSLYQDNKDEDNTQAVNEQHTNNTQINTQSNTQITHQRNAATSTGRNLYGNDNNKDNTQSNTQINTQSNMKITTNKEDKNIRKKENIKKYNKKSLKDLEEDFKEFWDFFEPVEGRDFKTGEPISTPKGSRKRAFEAYQKVRITYDKVTILEGCQKFILDRQKRKMQTCHVSTFLNEERFNDDYSDSLIKSN